MDALLPVHAPHVAPGGTKHGVAFQGGLELGSRWGEGSVGSRLGVLQQGRNRDGDRGRDVGALGVLQIEGDCGSIGLCSVVDAVPCGHAFVRVVCFLGIPGKHAVPVCRVPAHRWL